MIPPSGSGRSAPLPALSAARRRDLWSPHAVRVGHTYGSKRRGATASRGRYQSAPPWAGRNNVENMFAVWQRGAESKAEGIAD